MSKKPKAQPDDSIDQIMDAGQPQLQDPPPPKPAQTEGAAPSQTDQQKGGAKVRKTAPVFIYLAILFAAAFIMLLLAYFIQQRNSENAIDDLRSSMTATREELMEQNRQLQEELTAQNRQLQEEKEGLETQRDELQTELDKLEKELEQANIHLDVYMEIAGRVDQAEKENLCWTAFWAMEEDFLQENYEACAETFRNWYGSNYYITPEAAAWRAEEIYNELIRLGYLDEDEPARW